MYELPHPALSASEKSIGGGRSTLEQESNSAHANRRPHQQLRQQQILTDMNNTTTQFWQLPIDDSSSGMSLTQRRAAQTRQTRRPLQTSQIGMQDYQPTTRPSTTTGDTPATILRPNTSPNHFVQTHSRPTTSSVVGNTSPSVSTHRPLSVAEKLANLRASRGGYWSFTNGVIFHPSSPAARVQTAESFQTLQERNAEKYNQAQEERVWNQLQCTQARLPPSPLATTPRTADPSKATRALILGTDRVGPGESSNSAYHTGAMPNATYPARVQTSDGTRPTDRRDYVYTEKDHPNISKKGPDTSLSSRIHAINSYMDEHLPILPHPTSAPDTASRLLTSVYHNILLPSSLDPSLAQFRPVGPNPISPKRSKSVHDMVAEDERIALESAQRSTERERQGRISPRSRDHPKRSLESRTRPSRQHKRAAREFTQPPRPPTPTDYSDSLNRARQFLQAEYTLPLLHGHGTSLSPHQFNPALHRSIHLKHAKYGGDTTNHPIRRPRPPHSNNFPSRPRTPPRIHDHSGPIFGETTTTILDAQLPQKERLEQWEQEDQLDRKRASRTHSPSRSLTPGQIDPSSSSPPPALLHHPMMTSALLDFQRTERKFEAERAFMMAATGTVRLKQSGEQQEAKTPDELNQTQSIEPPCEFTKTNYSILDEYLSTTIPQVKSGSTPIDTNVMAIHSTQDNPDHLDPSNRIPPLDMDFLHFIQSDSSNHPKSTEEEKQYSTQTEHYRQFAPSHLITQPSQRLHSSYPLPPPQQQLYSSPAAEAAKTPSSVWSYICPPLEAHLFPRAPNRSEFSSQSGRRKLVGDQLPPFSAAAYAERVSKEAAKTAKRNRRIQQQKDANRDAEQQAQMNYLQEAAGDQNVYEHPQLLPPDSRPLSRAMLNELPPSNAVFLTQSASTLPDSNDGELTSLLNNEDAPIDQPALSVHIHPFSSAPESEFFIREVSQSSTGGTGTTVSREPSPRPINNDRDQQTPNASISSEPPLNTEPAPPTTTKNGFSNSPPESLSMVSDATSTINESLLSMVNDPIVSPSLLPSASQPTAAVSFIHSVDLSVLVPPPAAAPSSLTSEEAEDLARLEAARQRRAARRSRRQTANAATDVEESTKDVEEKTERSVDILQSTVQPVVQEISSLQIELDQKIPQNTIPTDASDSPQGDVDTSIVPSVAAVVIDESPIVVSKRSSMRRSLRRSGKDNVVGSGSAGSPTKPSTKKKKRMSAKSGLEFVVSSDEETDTTATAITNHELVHEDNANQTPQPTITTQIESELLSSTVDGTQHDPSITTEPTLEPTSGIASTSSALPASTTPSGGSGGGILKKRDNRPPRSMNKNVVFGSGTPGREQVGHEDVDSRAKVQKERKSSTSPTKTRLSKTSDAPVAVVPLLEMTVNPAKVNTMDAFKSLKRRTVASTTSSSDESSPSPVRRERRGSANKRANEHMAEQKRALLEKAADELRMASLPPLKPLVRRPPKPEIVAVDLNPSAKSDQISETTTVPFISFAPQSDLDQPQQQSDSVHTTAATTPSEPIPPSSSAVASPTSEVEPSSSAAPSPSPTVVSSTPQPPSSSSRKSRSKRRSTRRRTGKRSADSATPTRSPDSAESTSRSPAPTKSKSRTSSRTEMRRGMSTKGQPPSRSKSALGHHPTTKTKETVDQTPPKPESKLLSATEYDADGIPILITPESAQQVGLNPHSVPTPAMVPHAIQLESNLLTPDSIDEAELGPPADASLEELVDDILASGDGDGPHYEPDLAPSTTATTSTPTKPRTRSPKKPAIQVDSPLAAEYHSLNAALLTSLSSPTNVTPGSTGIMTGTGATLTAGEFDAASAAASALFGPKVIPMLRQADEANDSSSNTTPVLGRSRDASQAQLVQGRHQRRVDGSIDSHISSTPISVSSSTTSLNDVSSLHSLRW